MEKPIIQGQLRKLTPAEFKRELDKFTQELRKRKDLKEVRPGVFAKAK